MKRNYGIDLLRIAAMCMVVILHIVGFGGVLTNAKTLSANYEAALFLQIATYCAVNCYALISGYVGLNSRFHYTNIVILWLRVVFYTLLITCTFMILIPDIRSFVFIKIALSPVVNQQYWYFTSYFCLFFFTPLLNITIKNMTKKQCNATIIALIVLFSIIQTLYRDIFSTADGYSALWLGILYFIGAYIKKYDICLNTKKAFLGYFSMVFLTWFAKLVADLIYNYLGDNYSISFTALNNANNLICYTSPTIILCSVFLLLCFKNMKFSDNINKLIAIFSPFAFTIYLVHVHPLFWQYVLDGKLTFLVNLPTVFMVISLFLISISVFLLCSIIDYIRNVIFKTLKLKDFFLSLEQKYLPNIWN